MFTEVFDHLWHAFFSHSTNWTEVILIILGKVVHPVDWGQNTLTCPMLFVNNFLVSEAMFAFIQIPIVPNIRNLIPGDSYLPIIELLDDCLGNTPGILFQL